jgi:hypothetical protein
MVLGTRANTHPGRRDFQQKRKRLPGSIKGTPSACQPLHATSDPTMAATV